MSDFTLHSSNQHLHFLFRRVFRNSDDGGTLWVRHVLLLVGHAPHAMSQRLLHSLLHLYFGWDNHSSGLSYWHYGNTRNRIRGILLIRVQLVFPFYSQFLDCLLDYNPLTVPILYNRLLESFSQVQNELEEVCLCFKQENITPRLRNFNWWFK